MESCPVNIMVPEESKTEVYPSGTLISAHTNKPIPVGEKSVKKLPVFWCEACTLKLATPTQAIQHFSGKSHLTTVTPKTDASRKRDLDSNSNPVEDEPVSKKIKVDQSIPCKECNIVLNSPLMAEQHLKGKKHASTLKKLQAAENVASTTTKTSQESVPENKTTYCQFCCVTLNSDGQVKQHYSGMRHKLNAGIVQPNEANLRGGRGGRARGRGGGGERGRGRGTVVENGIGNGRGNRGGGRGGGSGRGEESGWSQGRSDVPLRGRGRIDMPRGQGRFGRGEDYRRGGGRGSDERGRGRGRGDRYGRGRGRGEEHGRGWGRGEGRGRGLNHGNPVTRGRGSEGRGWDRGRQNFRGSRSSSVTVGGQYGNCPPPPYDNASQNFNKQVRNDVGQDKNDSYIQDRKDSYDDPYAVVSSKGNYQSSPPDYHYSKPAEQTAPASNISPANMQNTEQVDNYFNYNSKNYYGGPYVPPSVKDEYDMPLAPLAGKGTDSSGNYYTNGYRSNNYSSQSIYEDKADVKNNDYQMSSDAMYDAYYA